MKLDILVTAAHPDDAELGCGGTIISHVEMGKKVGIADFTRGEMATRGTPEIRDEETKISSKILGISVRENLNFADVFFKNDDQHSLKLIKVIRKYKPEIVFTSAMYDRHPDHQKCAVLTVRACFLSGLSKIETASGGKSQQPWRPKALYHYIQDRYIEPGFVVDITPYWHKKFEAIKAFKSQFYNPSGNEPETYISQKGFLEYIEARAIEMGRAIGVKYGEGFTTQRQVGIKSLFDLV